MSAWTETLAENSSDHEATMASEACRTCGTVLSAHYDTERAWVECAVFIGAAHDLALNVNALVRDLPGVGSLRSAQARADYFLNER